MDTSEQNIKMVDCPQIQNGWEPKVGDWHYDKGGGFYDYGPDAPIKWYVSNEGISVVSHDNLSHFIRGHVERDRLIYLPRLDQLIEMLPKVNSGGGTCYRLIICIDLARLSYGTSFKELHFRGDTPEQAVLQGVMHELHSLKWDGEKWE